MLNLPETIYIFKCMINGDLAFLFLEVEEEEERGNKHRCSAQGYPGLLQSCLKAIVYYARHKQTETHTHTYTQFFLIPYSLI